MEHAPPPFEAGGPNGRHDHSPEDWGEALARTVAHLAAQLTMAQIRLRALATELAARGALDEAAVTARVRAIAAAEAARYLRENLGEALVEVVDVEALERDLIAYLDDGNGG
jgi:hypothetical protein